MAGPVAEERPPSLFSDEELVLNEILSVNPDEMTPIDALQKIARWKRNLSGGRS